MTNASSTRIALLEVAACGPVSINRLAFVLADQCIGIDTRDEADKAIDAIVDRGTLKVVDTIDGVAYLDTHHG